MGKPNFFTFRMTGTGSFPLDMLRYDGCYPADGYSVGIIEHSIQGSVREWNVRLCSNREPCIGRWASFGCTMTEIQKEKR